MLFVCLLNQILIIYKFALRVQLTLIPTHNRTSLKRN